MHVPARQHLRAARAERRRQDDDAEDADEPASDTGRRSARVLGVDSRSARPGRSRGRIGYVSENQRIPVEPDDRRRSKAFCRPWYPTWDAALANELRERFGLDPRARIKALSRGTRLKVQCLLALAPRPRLLILDEPFTQPRSGRSRRPDDRRPQPCRSRRLERAAHLARDGRRRAARQSRRLP